MLSRDSSRHRFNLNVTTTADSITEMQFYEAAGYERGQWAL